MNGFSLGVTKLIMWIYKNCGNFDEVIFALPVILFVTLLYWVLRLLYHKRKYGKEYKAVRKEARLNEFIRLLTVIWATALFCITITPTESLMFFWLYLVAPDENPFRVFIGRGVGDIELMPRILAFILNGHWDWFMWSSERILPLLILNIALFVPLGLALPFVCKKISLLKVALTGLSVSFFIEFVQHFIGRTSEMDDLICNTLGAVVGYAIYLLIKKLFPKFVENGKRSVKNVQLETLNLKHEPPKEPEAL